MFKKTKYVDCATTVPSWMSATERAGAPADVSTWPSARHQQLNSRFGSWPIRETSHSWIPSTQVFCPSVDPSIHPSVRPTDRPTNRPTDRCIHPSLRPPARPPARPSVRASISIYPSIHLSILPSICPSIIPSVRLYVSLRYIPRRSGLCA